MDSDDIAFKNKLELQLKCFHNKDTAVVGGQFNIFFENNKIKRAKQLPLGHEKILEYLL